MNILQEGLARFCASYLLDEKVLVAPTLATGHQIVESLPRHGQPWVNLRVETIRTLAMGLVGADLAEGGRRLLSRAQSLALVEQACLEVLDDDFYFGQIRNQAGFHRALQQTLGDLRASKIPDRVLASGAVEIEAKADELRAIVSCYGDLLGQNGFVDGNEVLGLALEKANTQTADGSIYYFVPEGLDASGMESEFLTALAGDHLVTLASDAADSWFSVLDIVDIRSALGEENEIREAFRQVLRDRIPFDSVEIIYTDTAMYVPLIHELSSQYGIPCTFSQGIPATFTRPGQAALAFIDWIKSGYDASLLRDRIAGGCIDFRSFAPGEEAPASLACARIIREAEIGWGRGWHMECLDRLIAGYDHKMASRSEAGTDDGGEVDVSHIQEKRRVALDVRRFVERLIEHVAAAESSDGVDFTILAAQLADFVQESASVVSELDVLGVRALSSVLKEVADLPRGLTTLTQAAEKLEEAVTQVHVNASNPKPGRIHVSSFHTGGYSGRIRAFVIGLDDSKHPGRDQQDPVLLDTERARINQAVGADQLPLMANRPVENSAAMRACLARLRGAVTLSFSCRDLGGDSDMFPSSIVLEAFRSISNDHAADYSRMLSELSAHAGFISDPANSLDETEWWLSSLSSRRGAAEGIRKVYPWLGSGRFAESERECARFTAFDGWIGADCPDLDPCANGSTLSASRLESLAKCPYAYFARHVLGIRAIEDRTYDPTRWLDARDHGILLHELFSRFMKAIVSRGEKPAVEAHLQEMVDMAEALISEYRVQIPPPNDAALKAQRDDILRACSIFLKTEEAYCSGVEPCYFEVPFGYTGAASDNGLAADQPVSVDLGDGHSLLLIGRIDRIDRVSDGEYAIWDYKTGSSRSIREDSVFNCGRQLQHALYAAAADQLLDRAQIDGRVVESGYFFPGARGEGLRIARSPDPGGMEEILRNLLDLVSAGSFIGSSDAEDCKYCDYGVACGGSRTSGRSKSKLENSETTALEPMRRLRSNGR